MFIFSKLSRSERLLLPTGVILIVIVSAISAYDAFTWFLEVLPVLVVLPILIARYSSYSFSRLTYWVLGLHALVLAIGAHYTYAKVPFFDLLSAVLGWHRNNYDKVGHFFQGFTPFLMMNEWFYQGLKIADKYWRYIIVTMCCLGISALYELFEWGVSELTHAKAEAFLGTQGYIWDTQSDMLMALIGAVTAGLLIKSLKSK